MRERERKREKEKERDREREKERERDSCVRPLARVPSRVRSVPQRERGRE